MTEPTSAKKFLRLSGSSMSTAIVSGITALMLEVNRLGAVQRAKQLCGGKHVNTYWVPPADLSPNAVKAALQYTAARLLDPALGTPYDRLTQGAGELNGLGALYLAYFLDTTAAPGAQWLTYALPPETTIDGVTLAWSQEVIWGTSVLSGAGLVAVRQTAWAENVVWGTGADAATWAALVDDDNIVWGTAADWGDNVVWGCCEARSCAAVRCTTSTSGRSRKPLGRTTRRPSGAAESISLAHRYRLSALVLLAALGLHAGAGPGLRLVPAYRFLPCLRHRAYTGAALTEESRWKRM